MSNAITAAPLGRASIVLAHIDHVERFAYERPGVGLDASLTRILRVAAKVGVPVRVEIKPGRIIVATGAGGMPAGANSVDEMFA
ncbi:hypothetical protein [Sphingomonas faeni]|uniref:hypothetical protein n=1 Tax=Sphingomonas faeni TaxID=185950 RepID=UPI0027D783CD|nr:hypothetical protein [Sphingomonas faeni]